MLQSALLVPIRLWSAQLIAQAGTLTSSAIDLRRASRVDSLIMQITSVLSAVPSVKVEYAVSENGVDFGSFDDYADLVAASVTDFPTPEGVFAISLPNFLAPFIKIKVTELGVTTDTLVTATLEMREGP